MMDEEKVTGQEEGMQDKLCLDGRRTTLKIKPSEHKFIEKATAAESKVQNPLENPLILHCVLSYLNNVNDLKNCRLVHSTWIGEASNLLKKTSIIKISKEFLKTSEGDKISMEVFRQLKVFQPQNLELFPTPHQSVYSKKNWGIVKKQMKTFSTGVKYLKFQNTEVVELVDLYHRYRRGTTQSFIDIMHYDFPNLVQLVLVLGDSKFSWPSTPPPPIPSLTRLDWTINCRPRWGFESEQLILVERVFKLAPNLESLRIREEQFIRRIFGFRPPQCQSGSNGCANMVLWYLNRNPSSCPNLKDLNLDYLDHRDIVPLSNLKIKLRSLKLLRLPCILDHQIFEDFLKRHDETLETFRFVFPSTLTKQNTYFVFPCLPKLKKLKLVHEGYSISLDLQTQIEDVDYAKQFPVLQSLVIKYVPLQGVRRSTEDRIWLTCTVYEAFLPLHGEDLGSQVCRTLRVLKLPYPELEGDDVLIGITERLSLMFPNVHNEHLN